jgi:tetratricopeptide (TPR) repeat protein
MNKNNDLIILPTPNTVGLVMIVKNEESVIERSLLSAIPFISSYVIVDTGSTDRTKEIIQRVMFNIPGKIIDRPWISFGHNRTEALDFCNGQMEWAIMLDADDNLAGTIPPPELWNQAMDGIMMRIQHGTILHNRIQIFRTGIGWIYEGVVHEYPRCTTKKNASIALLPPDTYMITRCEGSRSKDPAKYAKDALLLEVALLKSPADHRTLFYLAQSYRDAGQLDAARRVYQRYVDLSGGWDQERYNSLVNLINLTDNQEEKLRLTWAAIEICPNRLEAQYTYLRTRRQAGLPVTNQCYAIASITQGRKPCQTDLFINQPIYEWGLDDELAIAAFATGHFKEAYDAAVRCALNAPENSMRENAIKNAKSACDSIK